MHEDSVAFIAIAMEEALSFLFIISFRINKKELSTCLTNILVLTPMEALL